MSHKVIARTRTQLPIWCGSVAKQSLIKMKFYYQPWWQRFAKQLKRQKHHWPKVWKT